MIELVTEFGRLRVVSQEVSYLDFCWLSFFMAQAPNEIAVVPVFILAFKQQNYRAETHSQIDGQTHQLDFSSREGSIWTFLVVAPSFSFHLCGPCGSANSRAPERL